MPRFVEPGAGMTPRRSTVERGSRVPRGQPVIALAMILTLWIAARVTLIAVEADPVAAQSQLAGDTPPPHMAATSAQPTVPVAPGQHDAGLATLAVPDVPRLADAGGMQRFEHARAADFRYPAAQRHVGRVLRPATAAAVERATADEAPDSDGAELNGPRLTYLAAPRQQGDDPPPEPVRPRLRRWSADSWLLVRSGNQAPGLAARAAAYGGSQAGAVLRYGFAPASALRPQAYLRASTALGTSERQNEAALGLMVRPVRRLPIALLGEWRLQAQSGQIRTRPVVMAVTELPPLRLPYGVEAEAYAQGGWAGGPDATPFYDLSAILQRRVLRPVHGIQMSAGGGVWSGGQRGAARVDVGPRVELRGMVGPPSRRIGVRVGVDWRFRVAGRAEPGSGPALTVAAGF